VGILIMAVGDTVSGFTATFVPAASVEVIILFAGVPAGGGGVGITNGVATSIIDIPNKDGSAYASGTWINANSRGIGTFKIPITNTNYFSGIDGYSGIQTK
jgi:hypothetical protein